MYVCQYNTRKYNRWMFTPLFGWFTTKTTQARKTRKARPKCTPQRRTRCAVVEGNKEQNKQMDIYSHVGSIRSKTTYLPEAHGAVVRAGGQVLPVVGDRQAAHAVGVAHILFCVCVCFVLF